MHHIAWTTPRSESPSAFTFPMMSAREQLNNPRGKENMDPIGRVHRSIFYRGEQRAEQLLKRKGPLLRLSMQADSRTLLIAFGGQACGMGIPPFEFLSLTG